ncbi:hypothetical protein CC80DRAFT_225977 [Byssothecium circinans]|uniref:Uncharacterized protein n=1 Tax=Byssothecium circinans TaxID=147558 RepID=A0A6A5TF43_9PLEO|nr:hypothetical protein CC80DRAFT_225977 [Byssothecium circinans]
MTGGRYVSLKPDSQDQVDAMLPAIAKAFKIENVVEIIPNDICMRAWDCERREHIKDKVEDDPRNWGVQFLKDLQAIARLTKGDLATFQEDLKAKVKKHEEKHPWVRLADVKELKAKYQNPDMPSENEKSPDEYVSDGTEHDSYFEELVEPDLPKGMRRRRGHEMYEARLQEFPKKRKRKHGSNSVRLRRDSEGWERPEKYGRYSLDGRLKRGRSSTSYSVGQRTPGPNGRFSTRRPGPIAKSDSGESSIAFDAHKYIQPDIPLESQRLEAELECAEAELKVARLRRDYIKAKEQEVRDRVPVNGRGTHASPHSLLEE